MDHTVTIPGLASDGFPASEWLRAFNKEREAVGAAALGWDSELEQIAVIRAAQCAEAGELSHRNEDGELLFTKLLGDRSYAWAGENLYVTNWTGPGLARHAVAAWMASEPHRDNILWAEYGLLGAGYVVVGKPDHRSEVSDRVRQDGFVWVASIFLAIR